MVLKNLPSHTKRSTTGKAHLNFFVSTAFLMQILLHHLANLFNSNYKVRVNLSEPCRNKIERYSTAQLWPFKEIWPLNFVPQPPVMWFSWPFYESQVKCFWNAFEMFFLYMQLYNQFWLLKLSAFCSFYWIFIHFDEC